MKKVALAAGIGVVLALAAVVLCAGCIGSDPIVGTWDAKVNIAGFDVGSASVTFNADGTGSTTGSLVIFSASTSFTWKKVSDGKYVITSGDVYESKEVSVTFSSDGKTMTLDNTQFVKKA